MTKEILVESCLDMLREGQERSDLKDFLKNHSLDAQSRLEIISEADNQFLLELKEARPEPKTKSPNYLWYTLMLLALLGVMLMAALGYLKIGLLVFVLIYLSLRKFRASPTSQRNDYFKGFSK